LAKRGGSAGREERAVTIADLKSGVRLKTGHAFVLVVRGVQALRALRDHPSESPESPESAPAPQAPEKEAVAAAAKPDVPPRPLRLRVLTISGAPLANAPCDFLVGDKQSLSTDADGVVERQVQVDDSAPQPADGGLTFPDSGIVFHLKVGSLKPVDDVEGQQARLNNLGYFAAFTVPATKEEKDQFKWAVEEFQCDHKKDFKLKVTGECDPKTQQALATVYGS
jgi:hypothetical protein